MIICIGPICVPIWHLGILLLMLAKPLIHLFKILTGWEAQDSAAPEKGDSGGGATATDGVKQVNFRELVKAMYSGIFASVNVDDFPDHPDAPSMLPTFKVYRDKGYAIDSLSTPRWLAVLATQLTGASPDKLEALVARHAAKN
ncbi:uncharacterized protein LOC34620005 [Cyclospora cayetanensis]|uniref:Uncharacterized protein LOC34620005 n=1 Tax=Cyclospora cayetanensis TaxID=88456 RepID=A0A6P6RVD8_9EIME|nr:uncharacterized protein LOC34620005 [Cyclospora cayetanensis]